MVVGFIAELLQCLAVVVVVQVPLFALLAALVPALVPARVLPLVVVRVLVVSFLVRCTRESSSLAPPASVSSPKSPALQSSALFFFSSSAPDRRSSPARVFLRSLYHMSAPACVFAQPVPLLIPVQPFLFGVCGNAGISLPPASTLFQYYIYIINIYFLLTRVFFSLLFDVVNTLMHYTLAACVHRCCKALAALSFLSPSLLSYK